jgi:hypothetical protein
MQHGGILRAPGAKLKWLAALLGLGLALAIVPAAANADYNQCGRGNFCAWDGYNGASPFLYFHDWNDSNWHNDSPPDGSGGISGDRANSVRNNGYAGAYQDVIFWDRIGQTGYGYCSEVGEHYGDLGSWNNTVSSHEWVHNCTEGVVYQRGARSAARTLAPESVAASRDLPRH